MTHQKSCGMTLTSFWTSLWSLFSTTSIIVGLWPPRPIKKKKNLNIERSLKYCEFHKDFSHSTIECFQLQEEIEPLIINRYLKERSLLLGWEILESLWKKIEGKEPQKGSPKGQGPCVPRKVFMWEWYQEVLLLPVILDGQSKLIRETLHWQRD